MKRQKIISLLLLLIIAGFGGCSAHLSLSERQQLNHPPVMLGFSDFEAPPEPDAPVIVTARILSIREYEGGTTSLDTWPHFHLILEIEEGRIPGYNRDRFHYHTSDKRHRISDGQTLTFVFTEDGRLHSVRELSVTLAGTGHPTNRRR